MKSFLLGLLCLAFPPLAGAAPVAPGPEMFAFGSRLELQGNSPFNYCDLPLDLYQSTSRPDLGDLRVFNGRDQVVPHVLKRGLSTTASPPERWRAELPYFPLSSPTARNPDLDLHVEKSRTGTIIDLKSSGAANTPAPGLAGYLIDTAPRTSRRPQPKGGSGRWASAALELEWSAPENDFMERIQVETSADLLTWQPLTTATLARMNHQGYRLERNKITLPGQLRRYLRLLWPQGQAPVILTRVVMLTDTSGARSESANLSWLSAKIQTTPDNPRRFTVDLGGALPVERFRVRLPERNSLTVATISSAATPAGPYTQEWQGLLYHLVAAGEEIQNPDLALRSAPQRYWQINFATSEAGPVAPPEINCGWRPGQLYFLAQGEGPFRLLYGNATIQPTDFKIDNLLARYQGSGNGVLTPALAKVGPRFIQNAEIKRQIQAAHPDRKYVLWLVLGFGVGLIAWMSCQLYRQLQAIDKNAKDS